ncbi:MAG: UPF0182 family protein [Anaerolineae bacterium]|nr:UPF0182 family protein [Anaerolineae bacterium]
MPNTTAGPYVLRTPVTAEESLMSRWDDEIPDAFRRFMEEAARESRRNREDDEEPPRPPRNVTPVEPFWTRRWFWLVVLALVLVSSFGWIITTYTEWMWFDAVGYRNVWLRQWGAGVVTFLIFFVVAALFLVLNWRYTRRAALRPSGVQLMTLPGISWLLTGIALFLAFVMGQAAANRWETFLRYFFQVPYGLDDPVFGLDISFYLFTLPVLQIVHGWLVPLFVLALLGIGAIYLGNNLTAFRTGNWHWDSIPAGLRRQGAILLALLALLWAAGYWLNTYELLFSPRGVVFGAGYTDIAASLPVLRIQVVVMVLVAAALLWMAWRPNPRPVLILLAVWLLVSVVGANLYPALLQRYAVEPNELAREAPYIEHNIAYTRAAFGLSDVQEFMFNPDQAITAADLDANEAALQNIRLWDYRPLLDTYAQLQELRPYYSFNDVDIDRYPIDGQVRQVMLSAREMDKAGLENRTWVNQRLEFTHGYGIVMNPVDRVTPQGRPAFYIQDLPPRSTIDLQVTRPEIYYGELTTDIVYVASDLPEFDYPMSEGNVYSTYAGEGGVPISNFVRRLAFALRFGESNLILSEYITPDTRAMFHRRIQDRVAQIAPFLWQDQDPYLVVADGQLVWMLDTYTLSTNFPYSTPSTTGSRTVPLGINYIRNAVKVTVDAYDGSVNFYVVDPDDPIIQSYDNAFPGLFKPFSAMPEVLQAHVRYPEDLFHIQTHQYLIYHIDNVQVFYNQEDLWAIPEELHFEGEQIPVEPYYVIFPLPGQTEPEFLLIQPYTPAGRNNMVAWIAARNRPENYGELQAYELPRQELVFGPIQVESRINQDPSISQQFSLWDQRGSRVIRGNLLVIPLGNSFLYVEPIYLQAETSALPELRRVIVASGDTVVMRPTLDEALTALISDAPAVAELDLSGAAPAVTAPGEEAVVGDATIEELIAAANSHYEAGQAALQTGDWATYGREQEALGEVLQQLQALTGALVPAPTPAATAEP